MSNEPIPSDGEQRGTNRLTRLQNADWNTYGKLAAGAVGGLIANALILTTITGGDLMGIADGVLFLTPAIILSVVLFHRHDPVDLPFLGPALLFLTIGAANTISLSVRAIRGATANPFMSVVVLAVVAAMFTPGPFLGAYAVRRWWL